MASYPPPVDNDSLFSDLLNERNVPLQNVWMVRRNAFFDAHYTKKIFPSKIGQNFQLLLPLAYKYKQGYVNEPLVYYVIRKNSHFHTSRTLKQEAERNLGLIDIFTETLKLLKAPNEQKLLNFVWARFMHRNLMLGINHGNANLILDCCEKAQERQLNIFNKDYFDVAFLLNNYILPRINLQQKLNEVKADISKINDKLKN